MTYIPEIGVTPNLAATTTDTISDSTMGKEDFLKLLVAQLQNQDPLDPSDPTEFTAQLAQFSSLEQLFTVNKNLGELAASNGEMQKLSALSMIGNDIVSESDSFELSSDGNVDIGYRLEHAATEVTLYVKDESGNTVATIEGDNSTGEHFYNWDGTDSLGQIAPPGKYSLFVSATANNAVIDASTLIKGSVYGVDLDSTGYTLVTNAGEFSIDSIKTVSTN